MVLFYILQFFGPYECGLTPHGHPQVTIPMEGRKNRIMPRQSSPRMVCGEHDGRPWL